jgi:hypothetical protein
MWSSGRELYDSETRPLPHVVDSENAIPAYVYRTRMARYR